MSKASSKPSPSRTTRQAPPRPVTVGDWISASRPATLGLAVAPVILGWGVGAFELLLSDSPPAESHVTAVATLCFLVAIFLQIGVNFANDYSDGIRGTDAERKGPRRLTASGAIEPTKVRGMALLFFAFAAIAGLTLTIMTAHWWLLLIGAAALTAGWYYTGGKHPYGYAGWGEVAVFLFFGLVATTGTSFLISGVLSIDGVLAGTAQGFFAAAVLHVNNMRDRDTDHVAGKRTVATRLSPTVGRVLFALLMVLPFAIAGYFALFLEGAPVVFFALLAAAPAILIASTARTARELVLALKLTVLTSIIYCVTLAWALAY